MRPLVLVSCFVLAGCGASLPKKPTVPHTYFTQPSKFVTIDEPKLFRAPLKVHFKDVGSGPVLLLVHGLQTSSYSWRYNLEALAASGHRVIAVDLVGSGLSDHPSDFGYGAERMASFLDAFRRALGIDTWDVVGNSLGGAYCAAYAAVYGAHVRRLVIIHAPGFMDEAPFYGLEQLRQGNVPRFMSFLFGPWLIREYQKYHRPNLLSEEEVAQYSLPYEDSEGRKAFWHIITDGLSPESATRLEPTLRAIRTPTLLIWADQDQLIPPWTGYLWEQAIPGSRLVWVTQSSHFPHVEAPATTHRLILDFLEGPPPVERPTSLPPASTPSPPVGLR